MNQAKKFGTYCKMTCLGGSEKGECPCKHPQQCEVTLDPGYAQARQEARDRMARYVRNHTQLA